MATRHYLRHALFLALFIALNSSESGPVSIVSTAEASPARQRTIINRLQSQNRRFRRQNQQFRRQNLDLRRNLNLALRPAPAPDPEPTPFIEMVRVDNPRNAPDSGNTSEPGVYGSVPYEFEIGKYPVTMDQYTAFLNAVAAEDTYELYHTSMAHNAAVAGILRTGAPGSYSYTVSGSGMRPIAFVSWFNAARFCNWLHNDRPTGPQDASTTETGAYELNGALSGVGFERQWGAKFWIPSEDEWYKAAHHDPRTSAEGGPPGDDHYWLYPTQSDSAPTAEAPPGGGNSANFNNAVEALTDAGAYGNSPSFYGTYDQAGNVYEWNDAVINGDSRGLRGGAWVSVDSILRSTNRADNEPDRKTNRLGFRVAGPASP